MRLGLTPQTLGTFCSPQLFPSIWPHQLGYVTSEQMTGTAGSEGYSDSLLLIELLKIVAVRHRFAKVVFLKIEIVKI